MAALVRTFLFALLATCQATLCAFTWAPSNQFSFLNGGTNPAVATDSNGNAMAIWSQYDGTNNFINTSYFTAGAWNPTVTISSPLYSTATEAYPNIAMDATGTALAVWSAPDNFQVEAAVFNGSTWSSPTVLDTVFSGQNVVAMDGTGKGIAGWAAGAVSVALYDGTSWGTFTELYPANGIAPSVAISANGTALAVWEDVVTTSIHSSFYNGTTWGPDTIISVGTGNIVPSVGMTAAGTGIAVWDAGNDIVAAFFDGTTWSAPAVISTGTGNDSAQLAVQPNGQAVAVWLDSGSNVEAALFNGLTWGVPTTISTGGTASDPQVSMDGNGDAMAVWIDTVFPNSIESSLLNSAAGNVWSPPTLVVAYINFIANTDVAFSRDGIAFDVWQGVTGEVESNTFGTFTEALVLPPSNFTGSRCKDRFAWQTDCVNFLSWTPSTSNVVVGYILRRNGTVIAEIPANGPFEFVDHNRCKKTDVYQLTSVDALGVESVPLYVTLY